MPDLLAGSPITALDFTPSVADTQDDSFTCTNTSFAETSTGGTYVQCTVVFMAPTSGREAIHFAAALDNSGAASTRVTPHVREGGTPGAGADVEAASTANAVLHVGTDEERQSGCLMLEGLTPGDEYNVVLEHRVSGSTGTIHERHLFAHPLP